MKDKGEEDVRAGAAQRWEEDSARRENDVEERGTSDNGTCKRCVGS